MGSVEVAKPCTCKRCLLKACARGSRQKIGDNIAAPAYPAWTDWSTPVFDLADPMEAFSVGLAVTHVNPGGDGSLLVQFTYSWPEFSGIPCSIADGSGTANSLFFCATKPLVVKLTSSEAQTVTAQYVIPRPELLAGAFAVPIPTRGVQVRFASQGNGSATVNKAWIYAP